MSDNLYSTFLKVGAGRSIGVYEMPNGEFVIEGVTAVVDEFDRYTGQKLCLSREAFRGLQKILSVIEV
jgi:hypothetical protein